jgi:SAM-dependent methyltransferase
MAQKHQDSIYDGWLYHLFVDPVLGRVRRLVREQVAAGSSLIDIGCGTGELLFSLADRCSELVGVETSSRMWSYANRRAQDQSHSNLRFILGDAADLRDFPTDYFDYATACMVLHEMGVSQRLPVLREMQRLSRNLVLVDYRVPPPANFAAVICRIIERLAGHHHYRNYLSFAKDGGLSTLLETLDLAVHLEVPFHNRCLHLVKTQ